LTTSIKTWSALTRRGAIAALALALAACATAPKSTAPAPETSFTIAVIPDTQNYMDYTHQKAEGFAF
jgi:starvation-inducible outer membrane lipoprotein